MKITRISAIIIALIIVARASGISTNTVYTFDASSGTIKTQTTIRPAPYRVKSNFFFNAVIGEFCMMSNLVTVTDQLLRSNVIEGSFTNQYAYHSLVTNTVSSGKAKINGQWIITNRTAAVELVP